MFRSTGPGSRLDQRANNLRFRIGNGMNRAVIDQFLNVACHSRSNRILFHCSAPSGEASRQVVAKLHRKQTKLHAVFPTRSRVGRAPRVGFAQGGGPNSPNVRMPFLRKRIRTDN